MLIPKKTKYKYAHKVKYTGKAKGNKFLTWGDYGLQALEGNWITNNQIEATRKVISKYIKKFGKMHINIFPHMPKSKKPLEVRMGSGKGSIDSWVAVVKEGTIMFELTGVPRDIAINSLKAASYKLPVKCKIVIRDSAEKSELE
ncbi:MAG: 50S ribosomal protein L16 [Mycoplasmataceae bacterium]|nr:MAG: 50S ribosomal protein L16 [Mycoplasmataceae bacterium]